MSKAFLKCVRRGGIISKVKGKNTHFDVPENHYRRICIINEKTHKGPLKQVKDGKN